MPSPCTLLANTTAVSERLAASTAAAMPEADGGCHWSWIEVPNSPDLLEYSTRIRAGRPLVRNTLPLSGYCGPTTNCVPSR